LTKELLRNVIFSLLRIFFTAMHTYQPAHTVQTAAQDALTKFIVELKTPVMDERPVYVTGNFNNWHPEDERFKMRRIKNDCFRLEFPPNIELTSPIEYKYTRGGWANVELDAYGSHTFNRIAESPVGFATDFVPRWVNNSNIGYVGYLPKIECITSFYMPELEKHRHIWVLLPYNYHLSEKRYPVLYMQDGQNLFNPDAKFGNWAIDKKLAVLAERGASDVIIVAVAHGESERIHEYTGGGFGKKYINSLAKSLKPHIDNTYRTKPEREHTGIGGSSLGGLVSIMAGLMYPQIFSKLMIFSPSLWAIPKMNFEKIIAHNKWKSQMYLYAGARESKTMIPHLYRFLAALETHSPENVQVNTVINPEGLHKEVFWENAFPKALESLFFEKKA
jgi:predicted alpha/beta superfamily hydrolase